MSVCVTSRNRERTFPRDDLRGAWLIKIHLDLMKSCFSPGLQICGWDAVANFPRGVCGTLCSPPPVPPSWEVEAEDSHPLTHLPGGDTSIHLLLHAHGPSRDSSWRRTVLSLIETQSNGASKLHPKRTQWPMTCSRKRRQKSGSFVSD